MRGPFLMTLLALLPLLAGCASPAAESPSPEQPVDEEPGRTARGNGFDEGEDGDEADLKAIELLRTPLTFAGQGPESFDLTVPPGLVAVGFEFTGATFEQSGMRIELSGCGTYDTGASITASTGGAHYSDTLCEAPVPGPATVTISATVMVFEGTFVLNGFVPADAPAPAGNATATGP